VAEKASPTISLRERSLAFPSSVEQLPKWLLFSFVLHLGLIAILFLAPMLPSRSRPQAPVYVVDLVGGEKIGGNKLGTEIAPPPQPTVKTPEPAQAAKVRGPKRETKQEIPEKSKPNEKKASEEKKIVLKEKTKNEPTKPEPSIAKKEKAKEMKEESKPDTASADSVRERLLQSALERAKARAENPPKPAKGDALSTGLGEGEGAAGLGPGGRGGPGTVKGMDFLIYQNRMLSTIKDNWAWVGQRSNLRVVVHFRIKENGEIVGLRIVQPSGDPSYDESVLRAVKKSSPLAAPPESYRSDFAEVELTFRPRDLGA